MQETITIGRIKGTLESARMLGDSPARTIGRIRDILREHDAALGAELERMERSFAASSALARATLSPYLAKEF